MLRGRDTENTKEIIVSGLAETPITGAPWKKCGTMELRRSG